MEYIWTLPIVFVILLEVLALIMIASEEILYSEQEKVIKIVFILCVPIIGAVVELRKLDKYARYKPDDNGDDVVEYAFWDYYTSSQFVGGDSSAGSDGGGD